MIEAKLAQQKNDENQAKQEKDLKDMSFLDNIVKIKLYDDLSFDRSLNDINNAQGSF